MKKTILAMMAVALCALVAYAAAKAKINFEQTSYNFGTIQEAKGPVSHVFEFTNTGNANLVIIDVTAQCGCTRPEFPKQPIAPGKSGKIKVTYNPAGRPGAFDKTVTVKTYGSPSNVRLKIKGAVTPKKKR